MVCDFCEQPSPDGTYDRVVGLDMCTDCRQFGIRDPLSARGYRVLFKQWTTFSNSERSPYHYRVTVVLPVTLEVRLRCAREGWQHRLVKLFRSELQVGDPLFDDLIHVGSAPSAALADLLASEGLQSAILAVGVSGTFTLQDNQLEGYYRSAMPLSTDEAKTLIHEQAGGAIHVVRWHVRTTESTR